MEKGWSASFSSHLALWQAWRDQGRMGRKGWHERGYIPHYDGHGITQHIVFRLLDSVPPGEREGDDVLDRGCGSSVLRQPACADIVIATLLLGDLERYALQAWCIMPNHVHALVTTYAEYEIGAIVRFWKSKSASRINAMLGREGAFWARDYFDRYIRDEKHFEANKRYIEMNPVTAGLCETPEAWPYGSAGCERDL
jgi:REP element-mobilizing transposase RayT